MVIESTRVRLWKGILRVGEVYLLDGCFLGIEGVRVVENEVWRQAGLYFLMEWKAVVPLAP
jgi:hypothetical protein